MSYEKKYLPENSDITEEWNEREDRIASEFNNIADYPIEVGDNFTKWNSGKLEQWGRGVALTSSVNEWYQQPQTYPIPFVGVVPELQFTSQIRFVEGECVVLSETLAGFTIYTLRKDDTYDTRYSWHSRGRWK